MEEDVGLVFRRMHHMDEDTDIVTFIRQAISVASVVAPDQLKKQRTQILKLLFNDHEDVQLQLPPPNKPAGIFSSRKKVRDQEAEIKIVNKPQEFAAPNYAPPAATPTEEALSPPRKTIRIKIKKPITAAAPNHSATTAFNHNTPTQNIAAAVSLIKKPAAANHNLRENRLEAAKRNLGQRYAEVAEKKAKRKIQCIDFSEAKNLLSHSNKTTTVLPSAALMSKNHFIQ